MISKSKSSIFEEFYIFIGVIKNDCSLAREKENPRDYIQYREQ